MLKNGVQKLMEVIAAMFAIPAAKLLKVAIAEDLTDRLVTAYEQAQVLERSDDKNKQELGRLLRGEIQAAITMRPDDDGFTINPSPVPQLNGAHRPLEITGPVSAEPLPQSAKPEPAVSTEPETRVSNPPPEGKRRGRPPGAKNRPKDELVQSSQNGSGNHVEDLFNSVSSNGAEISNTSEDQSDFDLQDSPSATLPTQSS